MMMIAFGDVIGAGLFVGSGVVIKAAGPAAVVSFAITGLLIVLLKAQRRLNRSTEASTSRTTALRQASSVRCKQLVVGHHEISVESETVRLGGEHLIAATAGRA